eukprot:ANDGO_05371.mRNA.1 Aquaporin TIP1-3
MADRQRLHGDYGDDVEVGNAGPNAGGQGFSSVDMRSPGAGPRGGSAQEPQHSSGPIAAVANAARRAQEFTTRPDKPMPRADDDGNAFMPVFRGFRFFRKYGTDLVKGIRWQALIGEFVGTFCFLFVGILSVIVTKEYPGDPTLVKSLVAAFAHGFALCCAIYMMANISGGHLNPAVSLAGIVCHKMDFKHGLLYMGCQFGGSVCAALAAEILVEGATGYNFAVPLNVEKWRAFIAEILFTFFFVTVILSLAMDPSSPMGAGESKFDIFITVAPLIIGLTLTSIIIVGANISGACLNPAHAFGPALVLKRWDDFEIYLFGPMIGASGATLLYEFMFSPKPFSRR